MAVSGETVFLVLGSLGNLGTFVYYAKKIAGSVEVHNVVIPDLVKTVEKIDKNQTTLFEDRNKIKEEIRDIKTIHKIRGCDLPLKKGAGADEDP